MHVDQLDHFVHLEGRQDKIMLRPEDGFARKIRVYTVGKEAFHACLFFSIWTIAILDRNGKINGNHRRKQGQNVARNIPTIYAIAERINSTGSMEDIKYTKYTSIMDAVETRGLYFRSSGSPNELNGGRCLLASIFCASFFVESGMVTKLMLGLHQVESTS